MNRLEEVAKLEKEVSCRLSVMSILMGNTDKWVAESYVKEKLKNIENNEMSNMDIENQERYDKMIYTIESLLNNFREDMSD